MKHNVLIVLRMSKNGALLRVLKCLQASRTIAFRELRRTMVRPTVFRALQDLESINQEVYAHAGMYLFVKERKRLGRHAFENVLRIQAELTFIEAGRLVLVKCASM